jgi:hypothetical protein
VRSVNPVAVLTLGDLAYDSGTLTEFQNFYDPAWGSFKNITYPAPGNHEYYTSGASGYFGYYGSRAPAAYYSFDIGTWHLISLDSEIPVGLGSPQETWLQNDLAAHPNTCTLAYWHKPRWSSGSVGDNTTFVTLWQDLYSAGADLVLNGHAHSYERFAPQDPNGNLDTQSGIREFVVGTGGESHHPSGTTQPNSEIFNNTDFGVLKLTLHPSGYDYQFQPAGGTFTDSGSGTCHGAPLH